MLRQLFSSVAGRSTAVSTFARRPAPTATPAAAALLSTRAALIKCVSAPTPAPAVGEYLRPHLDVLKALQKLLPSVRPQQQQPKLPSSPLQPQEAGVAFFDCLNRNARRGKKANHGKRPVSSVRRKQKVRKFGKK